jgi:hypothetical protein
MLLQDSVMGKIKNPKLFSKVFGVDPKELKKRHLLDPLLNGDTRLFIDPILLSASKNPTIKTAGLTQFTEHFGNVIRLLKVSKAQGDLPWRNAEKILTLNELPELCLGYSTQLGVYEDAAKTFESILLIIDVGGLVPKLKTVLKIKNKKAGEKKRTPEIVVVDAKLKRSASKR